MTTKPINACGRSRTILIRNLTCDHEKVQPDPLPQSGFTQQVINSEICPHYHNTPWCPTSNKLECTHQQCTVKGGCSAAADAVMESGHCGAIPGMCVEKVTYWLIYDPIESLLETLYFNVDGMIKGRSSTAPPPYRLPEGNTYPLVYDFRQ